MTAVTSTEFVELIIKETEKSHLLKIIEATYKL